MQRITAQLGAQDRYVPSHGPLRALTKNQIIAARKNIVHQVSKNKPCIGVNPSEDIQGIPAFCPTIQSGAEYIEGIPPAEHVPAGVILAKQGEKPSHVRLIRSGMVKLVYVNQRGQEFILGLRSVGWWVASTQVLLDVPNLYAVETLTPSSFSTMSADDFSQQLLKNSRMTSHYLSSLCREVVIQAKMHIMLEASDAENRLKQLIEEQEQSVWKTLDPTSILRQADVAKLISVTPEHLSRIRHKQSNCHE
jgi:CRP-like cAMP-binding protein